jgi:DNA repair protein RAD5
MNNFVLTVESKCAIITVVLGAANTFSTVGMGKTIMLSALIQTSLPDQEPEEEATLQSKGKQLRLNNAFRPVRRSNKPPSATLVVAPTSLLHQWEEELKRSSKPGILDIFVWHGQNRLDLEDILETMRMTKGLRLSSHLMVFLPPNMRRWNA